MALPLPHTGLISISLNSYIRSFFQQVNNNFPPVKPEPGHCSGNPPSHFRFLVRNIYRPADGKIGRRHITMVEQRYPTVLLAGLGSVRRSEEWGV